MEGSMNQDFTPGMEDLLLEEELGGEEKIDYGRYLRGIWRRKWLVLLVTILVAIPWGWHVKNEEPIYEAMSLIRFKEYATETSRQLNQSRIRELKSRTFAEEVVAKLGLSLRLPESLRGMYRTDIFKDFHTTKSPVPGRYELVFTDDNRFELYRVYEKSRKLLVSGSMWQALNDSVSVNGFTFTVNPDLKPLPERIPFVIKPFMKAVRSFRARIRVWTSDDGDLMAIKMQDRDPRLVASMVNKLSQIFIQESMTLKRSSLSTRKKLLKERVDAAKAKLDESERRLKAFKERHIMDLDKAMENQVQQKVALEEQISRMEQERDGLDHLLKQTESLPELKGADVRTSRYVYHQVANYGGLKNNPSMAILRQTLEDQEKQYADLLTRVSEVHPDAKKLRAEIEKTLQEIKSTAENYLQKLEISIRRKKQQLALLNEKMQTLPSAQLTLSELERDRKVNEELYLNLLNEYNKIDVQEAAESQDVDILDPAIVPEYPVNANKKKRALFGLVFGFVLGVGVAGLLEVMDTSLRTPADVKKHLKLPVLGTIPKVDFDDLYDFQDAEKIKRIDYQLVTHDYKPTPIGEAFRSLRTSLIFSKSRGRIHSIVLTSTEPGDGKSFTAANLAIIMAQQKHTTLLVDADLRRGVLHNTFNVTKEPGFTNYLTGTAVLNDILKETHIPNLQIVTCGPLLPNPAELLGSLQMRRFLDEVRRRFDFIIFDTPPLNAATDAVVLGTQVDGVAIVIRAGKTKRSHAKAKLELFANVPATILGAILNGTGADMGHEGYSYYHY